MYFLSTSPFGDNIWTLWPLNDMPDLCQSDLSPFLPTLPAPHLQADERNFEAIGLLFEFVHGLGVRIYFSHCPQKIFNFPVRNMFWGIRKGKRTEKSATVSSHYQNIITSALHNSSLFAAVLRTYGVLHRWLTHITYTRTYVRSAWARRWQRPNLK